MRQTKKYRQYGLILLCISAVLGGVWVVRHGWHNAKIPQQVAVEAAPVVRADVSEVRQFPASLEAWSQYVVAPKIAGRLKSLAVDIGDPVTRGQVIARLDAEEYEQDLAQAQAQLQVAQATLAEAQSLFTVRERTYNRAKSLRKQGVMSQSDLDNAEAEFQAQKARVAMAQGQVSQQQAALRGAEVRLGYTTIAATWQEEDTTRWVGERFVDEGTTLAANAPLVSLVDLTNIRAVFDVTERDYPNLTLNQPVTVHSDALGNDVFNGQLVRLAPMFQETTRQARAEAKIPNLDQRLKPGMFVQVDVVLRTAPHALTAPADALVRYNSKDGVFVLPEGQNTVHFVPLDGMITTDQLLQLPENTVHETDRVVILGQHLLADGAQVRVVGGAAQ